jgi:peptidyl-prolyl cis-trans isomerase SurA
MKKTIIALAIAAVAGMASAAQLVEAVVVRVGDRIVTSTQYQKRLRDAITEIEQTVAPAERPARIEALRLNLTNDLINELLIRDRADRLGLTVSENEVKEAINRLKGQYGISTDAQFENSLKQSGLTRAEMEVRLRETLITNKVFARELRNRSEMTDRELREKYDREKDNYRLPERARLREIVILKPETAVSADLARRRAEDLALQAKAAGADFAQIATTASESATKERGGELGEVTRGELIPDLDRAVFNAQSGAVIGPIETKSAWHIVKVEQRLPSEVPAFESVKERLRKDESEESFNRDYKSYIERLRKDAFVQINQEYIPRS